MSEKRHTAFPPRHGDLMSMTCPAIAMLAGPEPCAGFADSPSSQLPPVTAPHPILTVRTRIPVQVPIRPRPDVAKLRCAPRPAYVGSGQCEAERTYRREGGWAKRAQSHFAGNVRQSLMLASAIPSQVAGRSSRAWVASPRAVRP